MGGRWQGRIGNVHAGMYSPLKILDIQPGHDLDSVTTML